LVKRGGHRYGLKVHEGRVKLVGVDGLRYDYDVEVVILRAPNPTVGLRAITVTARDGDLIAAWAVQAELVRVRLDAVRATSMFVDDNGITHLDNPPTIADIQSTLSWQNRGPVATDDAELRLVAAAVVAADNTGAARFRTVAEALGLPYPDHKSLIAKRIRQARALGYLPPVSASNPRGKRPGVPNSRPTP
jgi:hypothetical protein